MQIVVFRSFLFRLICPASWLEVGEVPVGFPWLGLAWHYPGTGEVSACVSQAEGDCKAEAGEIKPTEINVSEGDSAFGSGRTAWSTITSVFYTHTRTHALFVELRVKSLMA